MIYTHTHLGQVCVSVIVPEPGLSLVFNVGLTQQQQLTSGFPNVVPKKSIVALLQCVDFDKGCLLVVLLTITYCVFGTGWILLATKFWAGLKFLKCWKCLRHKLKMGLKQTPLAQLI